MRGISADEFAFSVHTEEAKEDGEALDSLMMYVSYDIVDPTAVLTPPSTISARFSDDGTTIAVQFDKPADRSHMDIAKGYQCSDLFIVSNESIECSFTWTSNTSIVISGLSKHIPGDTLSLRSDVPIKASCLVGG